MLRNLPSRSAQSIRRINLPSQYGHPICPLNLHTPTLPSTSASINQVSICDLTDGAQNFDVNTGRANPGELFGGFETAPLRRQPLVACRLPRLRRLSNIVSTRRHREKPRLRLGGEVAGGGGLVWVRLVSFGFVSFCFVSFRDLRFRFLSFGFRSCRLVSFDSRLFRFIPVRSVSFRSIS